MKKLPLALGLLIAGCQVMNTSHIPTQAEIEPVLKAFITAGNESSAPMAEMMQIPKPNMQLQKATLQKCEEAQYEGKPVAYCDIEITVLNNGEEKTREIKGMPFVKENDQWAISLPSL